MNDLSLHFLQDVYDAERRSQKSMQKMIRAASDETLKQALQHHREQTDAHVTRLEKVFELVTGKRPRGKTCRAMVGLLEEVDEAVAEGEKGPVLDAALIACAQAVDHYEIARYGAMIAFALQQGRDDVASLMRETLEEEKAADIALTELAERAINPHADAVEGPDDEFEAAAPTARRKPGPKPGAKAAAKAAAAVPAKSARATKSAGKPAAKPAQPEPSKPVEKTQARRGRKPAAASPPATAKPAVRRKPRG